MCLCNLAYRGPVYCHDILHHGAFPEIIAMLKSHDPDTICLALGFTEMMLRQTKQVSRLIFNILGPSEPKFGPDLATKLKIQSFQQILLTKSQNLSFLLKVGHETESCCNGGSKEHVFHSNEKGVLTAGHTFSG